MALLRAAAEAMRLSARGYHRVLKVARTLADLDGAERGRAHPPRRGAEPTAPSATGSPPPPEAAFRRGRSCTAT